MNSQKGLTMGGFKRQNVSEGQKLDDAEDRISSLPDYLLQHILSFLETKDAVATTTLSRRWMNLWTGIPIVDFDGDSLYSNRKKFWYSGVGRFMDFVERVLLLRDASDIKRFRLSCCVFFSASRVHAWISAAVKHKVQELDLCLSVEDTFLLPHSVFNSGSLMILKLDMNCILQLPSRISFPSLKVLRLGLVTFQNDNSVERLFSCCPVLEELAILDCHWIQLKSVTICIPSLKSLLIEDFPVFGPPGEANGCEIKIDAAKLSFFKYCGCLTNDIHFPHRSTSVKASLHIPFVYQMKDKIASHAVKLFKDLKNVYSLQISNSTIEVNVLDHLPVFQHLTHLELSMKVEDDTVGSLIRFLELLPKLESLNFSKGFDAHLSLREDEWTRESAPNCLLSSLKTVNLHNFYGNNSEICLLTTLLKSAACLERINLFSSKRPSGNLQEWEDLRNQLEKFPRPSKHCVISVF